MKRIMLFARDPGGANVLIPVYRKLKEHFELLVYGKEFALCSLEANGIPTRDIERECAELTEEKLCEFLKELNPDFLLTATSLNDYTERYLWKGARQLGIRSAVILDQWMNMGIRFSSYSYETVEEYRKNPKHPFLPDKILVMDDLAKRLLCEEGIPGEYIQITGQPHFDTVLEKYEKASASMAEGEFVICYVSEPLSQDYDQNNVEMPYWGYNEKTNFLHLYRCLKQLTEELQLFVKLIIRPHPRERAEAWQMMMEQCRTERIRVTMDATSDSASLLKQAQLVCGMSSMFLLEGAICGKQIISIQIGLKQENPFVLSRLGLCQTQLTEEELMTALRMVLTGGKAPVEFDFIRNATDRVCAYIVKEIESDEYIGD